ncbi:MAG TPA: 4-alpha-glucanotransferase, partial [Burkholderiaceae bacterium]
MSLDERTAGALLHITSLPGPHGSGDFGPGAHHFVDWLASTGQRVWQVLP